MSKQEFEVFLDGEISVLKEKIDDDKHSKNDEVSAGKLVVYTALHEFMSANPSNHSRGVVGAINDMCQKLQLVETGKTFLSLIKS